MLAKQKKTKKNKKTKTKRWFCSMLIGTLGASLLGTLLSGKGAIATISQWL